MRKQILPILLGALLMAAQPQAALTGEKAQTMDREQRAQSVQAKLGQGTPGRLAADDPELGAISGRLLYGEILGAGTLDDLQSCIVSLAALTASQTLNAWKMRQGRVWPREWRPWPCARPFTSARPMWVCPGLRPRLSG